MRPELGGGAANRVYADAYRAGDSTLPDNVWDRCLTKSEGTHWNKKVLISSILLLVSNSMCVRSCKRARAPVQKKYGVRIEIPERPRRLHGKVCSHDVLMSSVR